MNVAAQELAKGLVYNALSHADYAAMEIRGISSIDGSTKIKVAGVDLVVKVEIE
jgi:hypothetical protein